MHPFRDMIPVAFPTTCHHLSGTHHEDMGTTAESTGEGDQSTSL